MVGQEDLAAGPAPLADSCQSEAVEGAGDPWGNEKNSR